MSKAELQLALNKKPDDMISSSCDSTRKAIVEVVQYSQWRNDNAGLT